MDKINPYSKKTLISLVVPFFNEEENLEPLYQRISRIFVNLDYEFELLLIDDGSVDYSLKAAKNLRNQDYRVKILSLSRNFGHQIALSAGIDYAQGSAVILMDSDLQHPPEIIPDLLKKWKDGFENIYTIRDSTGGNSFLKEFFSPIFYRIFRILTRVDIPMNSADFRLLDRKLVLQLRKMREKNRFLRGMISWAGFRSAGVEYRQAQRHSGAIKYSFKNMFFLAIDAITSFSIMPLYVWVFIGILFATLGFLYFSYVLYTAIFTHTNIPGWASVVSLVSILGGVHLIVAGLIGVYVGKIFEEVKQRPLYLISFSEGLHET